MSGLTGHPFRRTNNIESIEEWVCRRDCDYFKFQNRSTRNIHRKPSKYIWHAMLAGGIHTMIHRHPYCCFVLLHLYEVCAWDLIEANLYSCLVLVQMWIFVIESVPEHGKHPLQVFHVHLMFHELGRELHHDWQASALLFISGARALCGMCAWMSVKW